MPVLLLGAAEDLGPVHVPGGEVLERAAPLVLELDPHLPARSGREGWVTTGSGLDGGLLVGGEHVVVVTKGLVSPLPRLQVEHAARHGLDAAISSFPMPAAAIRTILARTTSRCGNV
jgi:hypothetical protein